MSEEYRRWFDSLVMYYAERGMQAPAPENVQAFYDRGATPAEVYESLNMKRTTVEAGFEVSDVDPGITQTQVANVSGDQFAPRLTVVTEGLAAGDRVVTEGTDRLREGNEVEVVTGASAAPSEPAKPAVRKPGKTQG